MKNIIAISIFTFASLFSSAQIKVYPGGAWGTTGNVAVGTTGPTGPTQKFNVVGDINVGAVGVTGATNAYYIGQQKVLSNNGVNNIFGAVGAGSAITNGSDNAFFGYNAGTANANGINNVFVGSQAGLGNTGGSYNVAVGFMALKTQSYNSTAWNSYNTAIGTYALYSNQPTGTTNGYYNTALGFNSGRGNTYGSFNTFIGSQAGYTNSSTGWNTFLGYQTGYYSTGTDNTFVGMQAGIVNSSGAYNTYLGSQAGYHQTTGSNNTIVGYKAGYDPSGNHAFSHNSFFGYYAGYNIYTSGDYNTAIGESAGQTVTTGDNNTFLGYAADVAAACSTCANVTAIGNGAQVTGATDHGSNTIQLGNGSVTHVWSAGVWNGSDRRIKKSIKEDVPGLDFINLLKPVTYYIDAHKRNQMEGYPMKVEKDSSGNIVSSKIDTFMWQGKYDIEKMLQTGLIAQQVDSAAQQIGYNFTGISRPKYANEIYGLNYSQFIMPLIKAVQELSVSIDALKTMPFNEKRTTTSSSDQNRLNPLDANQLQIKNENLSLKRENADIKKQMAQMQKQIEELYALIKK